MNRPFGTSSFYLSSKKKAATDKPRNERDALFPLVRRERTGNINNQIDQPNHELTREKNFIYLKELPIKKKIYGFG